MYIMRSFARERRQERDIIEKLSIAEQPKSHLGNFDQEIDRTEQNKEIRTEKETPYSIGPRKWCNDKH